MEYSFEDLQKMSDEEIHALNQKLAIKVFKRFFLVHMAKWILIIGVTQGLKAWLKAREQASN